MLWPTGGWPAGPWRLAQMVSPSGPLRIPEALGADARVAIDRIQARGPMAAAVGHAVVAVHLAQLPAVTRDTLAPGTQQSRAAPQAVRAAVPPSSAPGFLAPPQLPQTMQSLAPSHCHWPSLASGPCTATLPASRGVPCLQEPG